MKTKFFLFAILIALTTAINAQSVPLTECFSFTTKTGISCNSDNSLDVYATNGCTEPLEIKIAIRNTKSQTMSCAQFTVNPGDTAHFYTCNSDGYYVYYVRRPGSNDRFPSNSEINSENGM